jgi:hypothetical protein
MNYKVVCNANLIIYFYTDKFFKDYFIKILFKSIYNLIIRLIKYILICYQIDIHV